MSEVRIGNLSDLSEINRENLKLCWNHQQYLMSSMNTVEMTQILIFMK